MIVDVRLPAIFLTRLAFAVFVRRRVEPGTLDAVAVAGRDAVERTGCAAKRAPGDRYSAV